MGVTGGGAASGGVTGDGDVDAAPSEFAGVAEPSTSAPLYPWEWRSASGSADPSLSPVAVT